MPKRFDVEVDAEDNWRRVPPNIQAKVRKWLRLHDIDPNLVTWFVADWKEIRVISLIPVDDRSIKMNAEGTAPLLDRHIVPIREPFPENITSYF